MMKPNSILNHRPVTARLSSKTSKTNLVYGVLVLCVGLLGACSSLRPDATPPTVTPPQWYAPPLPQGGDLAVLQNWWAAWDEPVLTDWIAKAQAASPSLAQAQQQVLAARAYRIQGLSALLPQVGASVGVSRSRPSFGSSVQTLTQAGLQASWETGALGQGFLTYEGLQAQERASHATWHEARVLVAAEVAQNYFGYLFCQQLANAATEDARSRAEVLRNTEITERAGFTAPAMLALARASAAQAKSRATAQEAACENQVKALVALTAEAEPALRKQIGERLRQAQSPQNLVKPAMLSVAEVPAAALQQRPDIYRAAQSLLVASAQLGVARAQLLPSISFTGVISKNNLQVLGVENNFNTWAVGPLSISLPLFNRAGLYANVEAAKVGYEVAGKSYTQTVRTAVREVEQALVNLDSSRERRRSSQAALAGFDKFFTATEARYRVGMATLTELEDARRSKINAQSEQIAVELEAVQNWIALYVALGGGYESDKSMAADLN